MNVPGNPGIGWNPEVLVSHTAIVFDDAIGDLGDVTQVFKLNTPESGDGLRTTSP